MSDPDGQVPAWDTDAYQDILLHYAYALEALLNFGRGGIAEKIGVRCAWLIGRDDDERSEVHRFISRVYDARSGIAHGGSGDDQISIERLRGICRKVLAVYLALGADFPNQRDLRDYLRSLALSAQTQRDVAQKRETVAALLSWADQ